MHSLERSFREECGAWACERRQRAMAKAMTERVRSRPPINAFWLDFKSI